MITITLLFPKKQESDQRSEKYIAKWEGNLAMTKGIKMLSPIVTENGWYFSIFFVIASIMLRIYIR